MFHRRQCEALVAGEYLKTKPYSVEAVLFCSCCKYRRNSVPDSDAWMIAGISARLAMRMGYHRDPSHLTGISPFEGELRRRTFTIIEMFEFVLSFQAGLPPLIQEDECDVSPPGNILDEDFDEDCKVLPASRPQTDLTPMSYWNCKSRQSKCLRRVIKHANSFKSQTYERTMELDREIHKTHADVPPSLRIKPIASSYMDPAYHMMYRLNLEIMYLKSLCFLHRKYLSQQLADAKYDYSRKTCIDAALKILSYQVELHEACRPGGRCHNESWVLCSLTIHDFLLAATIACLSLYESRNRPTADPVEASRMQVEMYDALKSSRDIWVEWKDVSNDAQRAAAVLTRMLSKVPRCAVPTVPSDTMRQNFLVTSRASSTKGVPAMTEGHPSISPGDVPPFATPAQLFPMDGFTPLDFGSADPLDPVFGEADNIDWVSSYTFWILLGGTRFTDTGLGPD